MDITNFAFLQPSQPVQALCAPRPDTDEQMDLDVTETNNSCERMELETSSDKEQVAFASQQLNHCIGKGAAQPPSLWNSQRASSVITVAQTQCYTYSSTIAVIANDHLPTVIPARRAAPQAPICSKISDGVAATVSRVSTASEAPACAASSQPMTDLTSMRGLAIAAKGNGPKKKRVEIKREELEQGVNLKSHRMQIEAMKILNNMRSK